MRSAIHAQPPCALLFEPVPRVPARAHAVLAPTDEPDTPVPLDGPALVEALAQGHSRVFSELVRSYTERLFRFFIGMGVTAVDAEDLVQDTFLRAYRQRHRYDGRYAFTTWLFTIGRRLACNHLRRRRPPIRVVEPEQHTCDQTAEVDSDQLAGLWRRARELVPARQYQALWLHYGEGCDLGQVARILAVSRGNAKVLLHRGRRRLAHTLDAREWGMS